MADNMALMLLGFKDYNIEGIEDVYDKAKHYKRISLTYSGDIPAACPVCGNPLYKHGKRTLQVNDTPLQGCPVVLNIEIPRMRCRNEGNKKHIWTPELYNVDENHKMTRRALLALTEHSMRTTFEDAAIDFVLSPNTVKNVFVDFLEDNRKNLRFKTPAFIGIDEIKVKKLGELTVITDIEHRTLYDILQGRNQKTLTEYFMSLRDSEKVQWVCSDMYRPFEKSISDAMPNARWAIDHFHVVMKANEAVDAVRREIQKGMARVDRIKTKKGLAYTLKTRLKDLYPEDALKSKRREVILSLLLLQQPLTLKKTFLIFMMKTHHQRIMQRRHLNNGSNLFRRMRYTISSESLLLRSIALKTRSSPTGIALLRFLTVIRNAPTDSFVRIICADVDTLLKSYVQELYTEKQTFVQCLKMVL